MGFFIFLIVVVGAYVWFKMTHYNDSEWVKNRIKGRTDEQAAVIRYFCNDPKCLSKKPISGLSGKILGSFFSFIVFCIFAL